MKKRVLTAIIMAIVLLPLVYLGGWFMIGLATVISYVAVYELIKMHAKKHNLNNKYQYVIPIFASLFTIILGLFYMQMAGFALSDLVFLVIITIASLLMIPIFNKQLKMTDIAYFILAYFYGGILLSIAALMRVYPFFNNAEFVFNNDTSLAIFIYLIATTIFTDIGAQLIGILLGKHKLCPRISPQKTIEGSIGGTITGTIVGVLAMVALNSIFKGSVSFFFDRPIRIVILTIVTTLITIVGQLGDLVASVLKREYAIKDYGNVFPGHGGIMDRFDSLIFTGTFLYVVLSVMGVIV